jgi:hypothetical protein
MYGLRNGDKGNVEQFRYFGMTKTNRNLIQEEIKKRLNSGNACYTIQFRNFCLLVCCQKT